MTIPREAIRRHGVRDLRLAGEELADFVAIVAGIDDEWVRQNRARQSADAAAEAKRAVARARAARR
jgi:hypothetical protein